MHASVFIPQAYMQHAPCSLLGCFRGLSRRLRDCPPCVEVSAFPGIFEQAVTAFCPELPQIRSPFAFYKAPHAGADFCLFQPKVAPSLIFKDRKGSLPSDTCKVYKREIKERLTAP